MPTFTVVNIIPRSLSGEANQDSEPNLAVNPANPLQMAASAFTPNPAGSGDAPIYVSTDGGNTWTLQAIVPSDQMTADITIRFGGNGNLYAGILRTPFTQFDAQNNPIPTLNILRTGNVLSGAEMSVLVTRTGAGVDQPYIQAASVGGSDVVFCGNNDFNDNPQSANMDFSNDAANAVPPFKTTVVDVRAGEGDAPSIRPAIHSDGTVYGAFLSRISGSADASLRYDVVVVRDDNFAKGAAAFAALTDPSDGQAGRIVAANRLIPFLNEPYLGQERIGSTLTINVDPRTGQSGTVYVAWADQVGKSDYTIHLVMSTDRGATWSKDLLTITNATNPAVAINSAGMVAFVYQQLTGAFKPQKVSAANRWETHFRTSTDNGATWTDQTLATVPANQPPNPGPDGNTFLPYLGDYLHLMAVDVNFYGIFSANNTPDPANFPAGVTFQRNCDTGKHVLFDVDGTTPVDVSIDPFFFKVAP
ncbi:MAG TPA: sialidase family protein [Bryobacteraceae bacterium]|nr:sialidase family protein [Bryobacteraceae bacterium]